MKVPTRRFGRTEVEIPVLTCGGMRYQQSWNDMDAQFIDPVGQENIEAVIHQALDYGINHIETARGYGTSEMQLGWVLPKIDRDKLLIQTKIHPFAKEGKSLREIFELSMRYLNLEYVDFLSIHGINNPHHLEQCLLKGGVIDEVRALQKEGRVRFVGYSTHGGSEVVMPAAASGEFDYVNLHWYFVYHPLNWSMVKASSDADMGVFIISPNDKGGMLYQPSSIMKKHCAPLTPMQWHDCYCLQPPEVHTLSLGAATPSDFHEHVEAVCGNISNETVDEITVALDTEMRDRLGDLWMDNWYKGIPHHTNIPSGINVQEILRLWTFEQGLDLLDWAKMRYNLIGNADHWFPGEPMQKVKKLKNSVLAGHPLAKQIPDILTQANRRYYDETQQTRLSKKDD